jgi:carbon storage regulator
MAILPVSAALSIVLTRKVGEEIVIGSNIRLTVVAVHGVRVRIGINAPKGVVVDRQEIHERRNGWIGEEPSLAPPTADEILAPLPSLPV